MIKRLCAGVRGPAFAICACALGVALAVGLSGCSEAMLFSKYETFNGTDAMEIASPRSDILNVIAEVGKSLGYAVSSLDKNNRTIALSSQSSMLTTMAIGKVSGATITAQVQKAGRRLDLDVQVTGNFGSGGQDKADKLLENFKQALNAKLSES